ncbi:MAG: hypothetical protein ACREFE_01005, partial [Limisphaerales bacterium]
PKSSPEFFTGSYAVNGWFNKGVGLGGAGPSADIGFPTAASVRYPAQTPLFADGTWVSVAPHINDLSEDLFWGPTGGPWVYASPSITMAVVTIARHGSKPPVNHSYPPSSSVALPESWGVNVSFDDGHAALVKLPDLWSLTWNRTWVPHGQPGVLTP